MEETIQVLSEKPFQYKAIFEVSALYLNVGGEYLYLQKSQNRSFAYEWSVPAGKVEEGESLEGALIREVYEEIGVVLEEFSFLQSLYVRYPEFDFTFHAFHSTFLNKPDIKLSEEHGNYRWLSLLEAKTLALIPGGKKIIEILF